MLKLPLSGGGVIYHKTLAKLVQTSDGSNAQEVLNSHTSSLASHEAHVNNKSNPHGVTLSQLGYSESELMKRVINTLYPINSIKISYTNVNPGTYLPGTTWQLVSQDRYIRGANANQSEAANAGTNTVSIVHAHSIPDHSHYVPAHSHSVYSHTHSVPAHKHLQTVGADVNLMYLYTPKTGDNSSSYLPSKVVTVSRQTWSVGSTTDLTRFNYTYESDPLTSGSTGGSTTDTASTTTAASFSTYDAGGNITLTPLCLTLFIWRRIG